MTLDALLPRLDSVRQRGSGRWSATCPSHADKSPSLSVSEGEKGILLKCWSGCSLQEICMALGIREADLFFDTPLSLGHKPTNRPSRIDRRALAFQFELAALDLQLRAGRIVEAGKNLDVASLSDDELDRAIRYTARAYADRERANLFEDLADSLRSKEFTERNHGKQRAA